VPADELLPKRPHLVVPRAARAPTTKLRRIRSITRLLEETFAHRKGSKVASRERAGVEPAAPPAWQARGQAQFAS
jgi:hypothetical protein